MRKVFIIFWAVLPHLCFGALKWQETEQSQTVDVLAKKAQVDFAFTNESDADVVIKDVKTSCGCTATKLEKKTYAPGESGIIQAELNIGERLGVQRKTIRVYTDAS